MKRNIYIHPRVEKELERLKGQENTPGFAAEKAHQIICSLAGGETLINAGKLSRKGDARIRNCLKYDLGKGHRLVCVKEKNNIYVLFVGNHDSCHTWLDKHRTLSIKNIMEQTIPFGGSSFPARAVCAPHSTTRSASESGKMNDPWGGAYEETDALPTISQKDLRIIFQGIVNALS
ncbi:MAG: hypothetical protein QM498_04350 [Desulfobacterium sp.]